MLGFGLFPVYLAPAYMAHTVLCTLYSVMYVDVVVCLFDFQDWQSLKKAEFE